MKHIQEPHPFNDVSFDQLAPARAVSTYMICTTPRVGGTLLANLLQKSQLMGVPHEYFHQKDVVPALALRWSLPTPLNTNDYLDALHKHRASANGVFGIKAHFSQIDALLHQPSMVNYLKSIKLFVHLSRDDLIAQAVSYAKAHQTRNWSSLQKGDGKAQYDRTLISKCIDDILAQNAKWQKLFALYDIRPLRIRYEDLIMDTDPVCRTLCRAMGVMPQSAFRLSESPLKKQGDHLNDDWKTQFQRDVRGF